MHHNNHNNHNIRKKTILLAAMCSFALLGNVGCGKSTSNEIITFQKDMNSFYETIYEASATINRIDPVDPEASSKLLEQLHIIAKQFEWLDSIPIPDQYKAIDQFANEGMQYVNEAVRLYEIAFSGDDNYDNIVVAAKENYRRANLRLGYIDDILQGNEPEFENGTVVSTIESE